MTEDQAEAIAISALQHLAGQEDLLMRFCALTGIAAGDMRDHANQPGFLAGVLEFFLSHEPDLLDWSEATGTDPALVMAAHQTLAPVQEGYEP